MTNSFGPILGLNEIVSLSVINILKLATRIYPWEFGKPKGSSPTLLYRIEFARAPTDREKPARRCLQNNPHPLRVTSLQEHAPKASFSDHYARRMGIEGKPTFRIGSSKGVSFAQGSEVARVMFDPGCYDGLPFLVHNGSSDMYRFRKKKALGCLSCRRRCYQEEDDNH